MSIPRMRTITEALAEIKMADAGSAVTANCIRTLCKNGQVRCIYTGEQNSFGSGRSLRSNKRHCPQRIYGARKELNMNGSIENLDAIWH